jgi:hypothetical protein
MALLLLNGHCFVNVKIGPIIRSSTAIAYAVMWVQFDPALIELSARQGFMSVGIAFRQQLVWAGNCQRFEADTKFSWIIIPWDDNIGWDELDFERAAIDETGWKRPGHNTLRTAVREFPLSDILLVYDDTNLSIMVRYPREGISLQLKCSGLAWGDVHRHLTSVNSQGPPASRLGSTPSGCEKAVAVSTGMKIDDRS